MLSSSSTYSDEEQLKQLYKQIDDDNKEVLEKKYLDLGLDGLLDDFLPRQVREEQGYFRYTMSREAMPAAFTKAFHNGDPFDKMSTLKKGRESLKTAFHRAGIPEEDDYAEQKRLATLEGEVHLTRRGRSGRPPAGWVVGRDGTERARRTCA